MDKSLLSQQILDLCNKSNQTTEFTKEFQDLLRSHVDKEATSNYQRIIPNTGKFYGVPKPVLSVFSSAVGKFILHETEKAKDLLTLIWSEDSYESKQIVGKSLQKFGPKHQKLTVDLIESFLDDIDNWSVCDILAMYGIEPIVNSNPEFILPLTKKWIRSKNKWIRRFGVVSLRGYKRIKATESFFYILESLMEEEDRDVKNALAWIFRDISKTNHEEVGELLFKKAKSKPNKHTRWIIKNGSKKLSENWKTKILDLLD
ncbi:MAG: DNA alkylation repair protein [Candidatus Heimdallarchaeota archaeon]|nr:DNA alkylation repair protein [Candidatus Heimdallarchaeota archaeon]MCK4611875.1 DNA alkylation repair protein [Candidatus Heimdallarchaeota archaeon]